MEDSSALPLDQGSPHAIEGAAGWFSHSLTGSVATSVGVVAVAAIGLTLLAGRLPVRRGIGVVMGCFILFSAGIIANGLLALAGTNNDGAVFAGLPTLAASSPLPAPAPTPYDPYAGASVPDTRLDHGGPLGGHP